MGLSARKVSKMDTDERKGLPSASSFARVYHCPASFKAENAFPSEDTDDSKRGTLLHDITARFLKGGVFAESARVDYDLLESQDDKDAIDFCINESNQIIGDKETIKHIEERIFIDGLICGQIDRLDIGVEDLTGYIFDWKFGTQAVESAESNFQMMVYALLAFTESELESVSVNIIAPCCQCGKKVSQAIYTRDQYDMLLHNVKETVRLAKSENAPFAKEVGDYCQFCRAKSVCPTQRKNVEIVLQNAELSNAKLEITKDNAVEIFKQLNEWNARKLQAEKCVDAIKDSLAKYVDETKDSRFEWKQGAKRPEYDTSAVYEYYKQLLSPDKFISFCKPTMGKIFEFVGKISGHSAKVEKANFEQAMQDTDACEISYNKPTLKLK